MFWSTLHSRIGRQPLTFTQHNHIFVEIKNPETGQKEKIFLTLQYDEKGHPYFVPQKEPGGQQKDGQNSDTKIGCDTGLKDREGKPIHEGDVVQYGNWIEETVSAVVRYGTYQDDKPEYGFHLEWISPVNYRQNLLFWADKIQVTGSICDSGNKQENRRDKSL